MKAKQLCSWGYFICCCAKIFKICKVLNISARWSAAFLFLYIIASVFLFSYFKLFLFLFSIYFCIDSFLSLSNFLSSICRSFLMTRSWINIQMYLLCPAWLTSAGHSCRYGRPSSHVDPSFVNTTLTMKYEALDFNFHICCSFYIVIMYLSVGMDLFRSRSLLSHFKAIWKERNWKLVLKSVEIYRDSRGLTVHGVGISRFWKTTLKSQVNFILDTHKFILYRNRNVECIVAV